MELWPKETSICNCLLRKARNNWREPAKGWVFRMVAHYKKTPKCLEIIKTNWVSLEAKVSDHSKICASTWKVDEQDLAPSWGMQSRGMNNAS